MRASWGEGGRQRGREGELEAGRDRMWEQKDEPNKTQERASNSKGR